MNRLENLRDDIIIWFIDNYPNKFKVMKLTDHSTDIHNNPYHMEGSVWTHTMMVMTYLSKYSSHKDYKLLLFCALLHDIGKPECQELLAHTDTKPSRYRFAGHEGVSTYKSIAILQNAKEYFELSEEDIKTILTLISTHGVNPEADELRKIFSEADKNGAVRNENLELYGQYPLRKYFKPNSKDENKELILLVGIPCSGKSTLIKERYSDYFIISRDEALISFAKLKGRNFETYSEIYNYGNKENPDEFNGYFNNILIEAKKYDKIIVDMTNTTLKSRKSKLVLYPKHKAKAVILMTSLGNIRMRNIKRSREEAKFISDEVFLMMQKQFIMPVKEEGFEDVEIIID